MDFFCYTRGAIPSEANGQQKFRQVHKGRYRVSCGAKKRTNGSRPLLCRISCAFSIKLLPMSKGRYRPAPDFLWFNHNGRDCYCGGLTARRAPRQHVRSVGTGISSKTPSPSGSIVSSAGGTSGITRSMEN